jgi:hypothetical protein
VVQQRAGIALRFVLSFLICFLVRTDVGANLADGRWFGEFSQTNDPGSAVGDPQNSELNGNTYTNHFFEFSFTYPRGWRLISSSVSLIDQAIPARASQGNATTAQQSAEQRVYSLLLAVESTPHVPPDRWRRIGILATKLKHPSTSVPEHLRTGAEMLRQRGSRVQMIGNPEKMILADRQFWRQRMAQDENGHTYQLEIFVTKEKGYVLQVVLWAWDAAGAQALEPVIQSLQFGRS